jgi:hypothetical protein
MYKLGLFNSKARLEAERAGRVTFISDVPCPHDHLERYTATLGCAACSRIRNDKYRPPVPRLGRWPKFEATS